MCKLMYVLRVRVRVLLRQKYSTMTTLTIIQNRESKHSGMQINNQCFRKPRSLDNTVANMETSNQEYVCTGKNEKEETGLNG